MEHYRKHCGGGVLVSGTVSSSSRGWGHYTVQMAVFSFWMIVVLVALIGVAMIVGLALLFARRDWKDRDGV